MQINITEREAEALIRLKRMLTRMESPIGLLKRVAEDYLPEEDELAVHDVSDELAIISSLLDPH